MAGTARPASEDEAFRDMMAVTSMIQYCHNEVRRVSPAAALLLSNSRQILVAEMNARLAAALHKAA
jgi:hypothetical protein